MFRVMAGETAFIEGFLREYKEGKKTAYSVDDQLEVRGPAGRIMLQLGRPLFQLQHETNYYTDRYLTLAEAFDVPLSGYQEARTALLKSQPLDSSWHFYDLTGNLIRIETSGGAPESYPFRVGSLEGMRRAALLTTQLRSRPVPKEKVPDELLVAELTDPYTHEPFQWNAEHQSVRFVGPEDHRWHIQEYLY